MPNFLEAQVRSKISRVRADQRTLATAIESYRVDHNLYPAFTTGVYGPVNTNRGFVHELVCLTTPVAYLASVEIVDPFNRGQDTPRPVYGHEFYSMWYSNLNLALKQGGLPRISSALWQLFSYGPDFVWSGPMDGRGYLGQFRDGVGGAEVIARYEYDASNGTRSAGDLLKFP